MKPIKTLDELKKELMSEHGAVFLERFRYRLINNQLHIFSIVENTWRYSGSDSNHGFLFEIGKWFYYEKPKKIVKEEIEGYCSENFYENIKSESWLNETCFRLTKCNLRPIKTTIIFEREVDE